MLKLQILKLNKQHYYSTTKIVETINKSCEVIMNLPKDNYRKRESCGNKRAIIACSATNSTRQITEEAEVTTNVRNVRRLLKNCEHLERRKLQRKSWLKQEHKLWRLQFAEKHLCVSTKRRRVIFTDEKR